ncbi:MAG: DUF934 domain-containing protein [Azonexaceae bacterium]|nr:DUF934 domain-containing protein [Azonexaceae bacterium]
MAPLIDRHGIVSADPWRCIDNEAALDEAWGASRQHLILAIPLWRHHRARLTEQGHALGVWLGPEDEPEELAPDLAGLPVIAVQFASFTDGRGYSLGRILRQRMAYGGDLRATGDIQRDQIYLLHKCGFSSFALRADQSPEEALAALGDFRWAPLVGC